MTNQIYSFIPSLACKALWYEVSLTPKPGLVDRFDNGAHHDMNFYTFIDSIVALSPFFDQYYKAGLNHTDDLPALFSLLRKIGFEAETNMLKATHQINTHKGANFSFALILGATGYYLKHHKVYYFSPSDTEAILDIVSGMCKHLIEMDFSHLETKDKLTHGEKLYLSKGITGIRGEAAAGYPMLRDCLMPFIRENKGLPFETLFLRALLMLMSQIEDINLIYRGGYDSWIQIKEETKTLIDKDLDDIALIDALSDYNKLLIKRYLSPGGAADVLSLGIFFSLLEDIVISPY